MKLMRTLLTAGLVSGLCSTALYAADFYVTAIKSGPVAGTPLAVVALQASTNTSPTRLKTNVNQRGNTAGKWVSVGQAPAVTAPLPVTGTATTAKLATNMALPALAVPVAGATFASFGALMQSGKVQGGDRIFLLDGYHGPINVRDKNFTSAVTIAGMPGATAQLDSIEVVNSANLVFRDLKVWATSISSGGIATVRAYGGAHDIVFTNLDVRSVADAGNYMSWSLASWKANTRGGFLVDGNKISIVGNRLTGTRHAIISMGDNALIEKNIIDGFAGDGMRALGDFSTVNGNKLQNCFHIDANHDDGFQSFSRGPSGQAGAGVVYNLTIENNKIYEWNSPSANPLRCTLQGIGMFDGLYENVMIRNNIIAVSNYHGITVSGGRKVVITQNTVVHPLGLAGSSPWIRISPDKDGTSPTDVMVANNTVNGLKVNPNAARRVAIANNIVVTKAATEFTSVSKQDYTLLTTAKSANAGNVQYATPVDIMGVPRPKGTAPDAGAYESQ